MMAQHMNGFIIITDTGTVTSEFVAVNSETEAHAIFDGHIF